MSLEAAIELLPAGKAEDWNNWRSNHPDVAIEVCDKTFTGVELKSVNLAKTTFRACDFNETVFEGADLREWTAVECSFNRSSIIQSHLHSASFEECSFVDCVFRGSNLEEIDGQKLHFRGRVENASFQRAELADTRFERVKLIGCSFKRCKLPNSKFSILGRANTNFREAELAGTEFLGGDYSNVDFSETNLTNARFTGVRMNSATRFLGAIVNNCSMERHALESLKDYGGLTVGDLMDMKIVDDVARMRRSFGGFWRLLHWVSVFAFLCPYVWFIARNYAMARFMDTPSEHSITLATALTRYVLSGGTDWGSTWQVNWLPFSMFLVALLYNAVRLVLIIKTTALEWTQVVSGVPSRFSLIGFWRWMYETARWGYWVNLAIVAVHTSYFLTQRIPLPSAPPF